MIDPATTTRTVAGALQDLKTAADNAEAAKTLGNVAVSDAKYGLRAAVDAARELGMRWGEIGDALGIRRGNAYQLYRQRGPRPTAHTDPA